MLPLATEWVLPNGMRAGDLPPAQLAAFPPEVGRADVAFDPLHEGGFLLDIRSHFHVPVTVAAKVLFGEPILAMRLPSFGRAQIRNGHATMAESVERWTLSLVSEAACQIDNPAGESYGALVAVFTRDRLRRLLDGEVLAAPLRDFLAGRNDGLGATVRTSATLHRLAGRLRGNPYSGAMAGFYREGLTYQMLAAALADFSGELRLPPRLTGRDRRRVLAARDILLADISAPPGIEALARRVGMSQRRLSEAFRSVFGASPFQCLTQWRLDHARLLLVRGDLSVKQVAMLMGYTHVSSFSHAYARRFGHSPTQDRESS